MHVGAIWGRWIGAIAAVVVAVGEMWRARRAVLVSRENDRFIIRVAAPDQDRFIPAAVVQGLAAISSVWRNLVTPRNREPAGPISDPSLPPHGSAPDDVQLAPAGPREATAGIKIPETLEAGSVVAVLPAGLPIPDEVARVARSGIVIRELSTDQVVVRRISVPAQARQFLPGIVRNQLERLSPWQAEQAVYGFDAEENREDVAALEVRVFITSRAVVASARAEFDAIGLPIDRIVAREDGTQAPAAVTLWSRLADAPHESVERARRPVGNAIAALIIVSIVLSSWAFSSAASIRGESEDVAARSRTLQRQLQGARAPATASLAPAVRAWLLKETSPSAVIVLEVLSRALPDTAYLTELRLDNTTLRIIGLANDAPSLIAPLERSGHFTEVHFFAPTTRDSGGRLFRFHIEARVVPRFEITEN